MTPNLAIALLLALAATVGAARWITRWLRQPDSRPPHWHMAMLLVLQLVATLLLFCVLVPPERALPDATLVVMTSGAEAADAQPHDGEAVLVALPEAGLEAALRARAGRMPDLATALRTHPQATRLEVLGHGLEPRDVASARGLAIGFAPPPLPHGIVELQSTGNIVAGGRVGVSGRVHGVDGGRLELLDPSGAPQDHAVPEADGRFRLEGPVRVGGPALWRLRLSAPQGSDDAMARIEEIDIPVDVRPGSAPRVLLLAGAPGPEVKYLRRWAADAGVDLHSRMALGGGTVVGDGPVDWDAGSLAGFDLVILDERAWAALGGGARQRLLEAVEAGLGLMLRITAAPDATTEEALRQLGFALAGPEAAVGREVRLAGPRSIGADNAGDAPPTPARDTDDGPDASPGAATAGADDGNPSGASHVGERASLPSLARQPVRVRATAAVPLLHDAEGVPLAHWRALGRGRVAAWNLDQTFRLVLAGHADRHARLWSDAVGTLARAGATAPPRLPDHARVGGRAVLCDLPADVSVVDPDGARLHPLPDPAARGCAAVWPHRPGWHRVGHGDAAIHMYVREGGSAAGIEAMARRDAMHRLQAEAPVRTRVAAVDTEPGDGWTQRAGSGPRWPWFLGWLAATALLWWLERRRGRPWATPSGLANASARRVSRAAAPRGSPRGG